MKNILMENNFVILFLISLGVILGSFCNVVINRTISGESIIYPPSHCDNCNHRLNALDLIPIIGFISLKGKCRYCKSKISIDNILIEILSAILVLILFDVNDILKTSVIIIATFLAMIIAIIDFRTMDIYMNHIFILMGLGVVYRCLYIEYDLKFFIIVIIFAITYFIIYKLSHGGIGDGDIYFYLALLLFIVNQKIIWFILLSVWVAAIFSVIIAIKNKSSKIKIPFCIYIFISFIIINLGDRFIS